MVGFLMGPITSTIFPRHTCNLILEAEQHAPPDQPRHEHCFEIQYDFLRAFWLLLTLGGFVLVGMAWNATTTKTTTPTTSGASRKPFSSFVQQLSSSSSSSPPRYSGLPRHRRRSSSLSVTEESSSEGFSLPPITSTTRTLSYQTLEQQQQLEVPTVL